MRTIHIVTLVFITSAFNFFGCGSDNSNSNHRNGSPNLKYFSGSLGSCNITGSNACIDFSYTATESNDPLSNAQFKIMSQCSTLLFGSYSRSSCDRTEAVAFCSYTARDVSLGASIIATGVITYTAPITVSDAQARCARVANSTFSTTAP